MTQQSKNWLKDNAFNVVTVTFTLLTALYFGVIKSNDDHNAIIENQKVISELKGQIKVLDDKKVDKEVFFMIQAGIADIKADVREVRLNQLNTKK